MNDSRAKYLETGTKFTNVLYNEFSVDYDNFVKHYKIDEILSYLNCFPISGNVLGCGVGTGLFSYYLS